MIQAACPDDRYRDGRSAVMNATKACELTGWKMYETLDTLAAAYAEVGDFDAAVKWKIKSIGMLPADTPDSDRSDAQVELGLYRQRKPHREEQKASSANHGERNSR